MGPPAERASGPPDGIATLDAPSRLATANSAATLVLDAACERILESSSDLSGIAAAMRGPDGRVRRALGLDAQIQNLGQLGPMPRCARLRLDPRGLAAPTTCWLSRVIGADGSSRIVVALVGRLPDRHAHGAAPGPVADSAEASPIDSVAAPAIEPPALRPRSTRIIWRSDAQGRLTSIDGGKPGTIATLQGRLWSSFPDGGVDILAHFRACRTFRALVVSVRDDETGEPIELAVSGSPMARTDPAGDWAGFATERRIAVAVPEPVQSVPDGEIVASPDPSDLPTHPDPEVLRSSLEGGPQSPPRSLEPSIKGAGAPPQNEGGAWADIDRPDATLEAAPAELTGQERDAFREIARALGALLSEDDPAHPSAAAGGLQAWGRLSSNAGETITALLESLPAGVLVFRGTEILHRNGRFSDLLGAADATPLDDVGLMSVLLSHQEGERLVEIPRATGTARLLLERSTIDWDGQPAALILARAAPAVLRWFEPSPSEAKASFAAVTHAQAMLGPSFTGRGAIDPRGRILVVKSAPRSAARPEDGTGGPKSGRVRATVPGGREPSRTFPERGPAGSVVALRARVERLLALEDVVAESGSEPVVAQPNHSSEEAARNRLAFFAKIGRAVRASLVTIRGTADAVLAEPSVVAPGRERIRAIRSASDEAASLLDGLLAWMLVASGRADRERQSVQLNDVVLDCIGAGHAQAAGGRVLLRSSLSPDVAVLTVDERSLRNAAGNAIAHAIEQSQPGGQVIVSTTVAERGEAVLRVRSTGFEMSADAIAQALDLDAKPSAASSDRASGLLGLTLAKALVEVNGGRLAIASRSGEGTLVELGFPARTANTA